MAQTSDAIWSKLIDAAASRVNHRVLSTFVEAGNIAAAIMTDQGNIYTGVCIDAASALGMCAERNAVGSMITCGESRITHLVCIRGKGFVYPPCGACRDLLMQMDPDAGEIKVLIDRKTRRWVRLKTLLPTWWESGIHGLVEHWNWQDEADEEDG